MDEISSGMEIYYSSRMGGRYLKTSFILCDDYVELLSKLWLSERIPKWSDKKPNGSFKNFRAILDEVTRTIQRRGVDKDIRRACDLVSAMRNRRARRNGFFHSTQLLDLSTSKRSCVEAFCDLFEFGELLFGDDWNREIEANVKTETLCVLFCLDRKAFSDASVEPRISALLETWPRREKDRKTIPKKGTQYAKYPEDMHLRLCLDWGGLELRDALKSLLSQS